MLCDVILGYLFSMKTKLVGLYFFLSVFLNGFSQETDVTNLVRITVVNPGISYEARVGKLQTVFVQPFMKTTFHTEAESFILIPFRIHTTYYFDPAITAQFRQYYLTRKQKMKMKDHSLNSMNYVALYEELFFTKRPIYQNVTSRRGYNKLAIVWGLQRNLSDHFSFNANLGYGYTFPTRPFYSPNGQKFDETLNESIVCQINFGFWLNKKTKHSSLQNAN